MKKSLILTSCNLGDGLIFAALADHLAKSGREVTLLSPLLIELASWMPQFTIGKTPPIDDLLKEFCHYDEILIEMHDAKIIEMIHAKRGEFGSKLRFLCPIGSRLPLIPEDYVFDRNRSMVENVISFLETLGIVAKRRLDFSPPQNLNHRSHLKRVAIHALSANRTKNYPLNKFIKIASELQKLGFEPVFLAHQKENFSIDAPFQVFTFSRGDELAAFIYESGYFIGNDSGPGHMASALDIPGIVITKNEKKSRLWRPGWRPMQILYPPKCVPNWRGLRLRDAFWQKFIAPRKVLQTFKEISK